jgi:hypothetical protein
VRVEFVRQDRNAVGCSESGLLLEVLVLVLLLGLAAVEVEFDLEGAAVGAAEPAFTAGVTVSSMVCISPWTCPSPIWDTWATVMTLGVGAGGACVAGPVGAWIWPSAI